MAFDARGTGVGTVVGSRTVTLASSYAGTGGVAQVRQLTAMMLRLAGQCEALVGTIGAYTRANQAVLDFFDVERATALLTRCAATKEASQSIVAHVQTIIGPAGGLPPAAAAGVSPGSTPDATANGTGADADPGADTAPNQAGPDDEDVEASDSTDDEQAADAETDPTRNAEPGSEAERDNPDPASETMSGLDDDGATSARETALGPLPPNTSNQVVFAEELGALREGLRRYQFRVASSPIELGESGSWRQFLQTFARTYYVSATLRVAGRWDFITSRLGLPASISTLALGTPFQLGRQAELVCLADFPSWAEQSDGAMRTVAHQLAGYAREVVHEVPVMRKRRPAPSTPSTKAAC